MFSKNHQDAPVTLDRLTRRSGGEWLRIHFKKPMTVSSLTMHAQNNGSGKGVIVHEVVAHTKTQKKISLKGFGKLIASGNTQQSSDIGCSGEALVAVDIRAESVGVYSDLRVDLQSSQGTVATKVTCYDK